MIHLHPPPPELAPCVPSSAAAPRERVRVVVTLCAGCGGVDAMRVVPNCAADPAGAAAGDGVGNGAIGGRALLFGLVAIFEVGTFAEDPRPRIDGRSENPRSDFLTLSIGGVGQ
jgi:hypothetical protein